MVQIVFAVVRQLMTCTQIRQGVTEKFVYVDLEGNWHAN